MEDVLKQLRSWFWEKGSHEVFVMVGDGADDKGRALHDHLFDVVAANPWDLDLSELGCRETRPEVRDMITDCIRRTYALSSTQTAEGIFAMAEDGYSVLLWFHGWDGMHPSMDKEYIVRQISRLAAGNVKLKILMTSNQALPGVQTHFKRVRNEPSEG